MTKVLIYGAGSIGNHLSQASRRLGFEVTVCDTNPEALERMKTSIYPTRYGKWDDEINLIASDALVASGDFDIIIIGTPPDIHKDLALRAIKFNPNILHIEKPLFRPTDDIAEFATEIAKYPNTMVTVGYDHSVAPSFQEFLSYITNRTYGSLLTVDAATREHWEGIFKAHPWLKGPHDSYLGYTQRGGGASGEHSHALHLALVTTAAGNWPNVSGNCVLDMVQGSNGEAYDRASFFTLRSSDGRVGRVVQDVLAKPTEKTVRAQLEEAVVTWRCESGTDIVEVTAYSGEQVTRKFSKNRPDDFFYMMKHYESLLAQPSAYSHSPIAVASGLEVMRIIQTGIA
jgi:predicted dehydrogenase